jgi:hypothetical protein
MKYTIKPVEWIWLKSEFSMSVLDAHYNDSTPATVLWNKMRTKSIDLWCNRGDSVSTVRLAVGTLEMPHLVSGIQVDIGVIMS